MPFFAIFAASALAAAQWPGRPVENAEYPSDAKSEKKSAAALIDVMFDPAGKVIKCELTASEGDAGLAGQLCPIMSAKTVKPARDADGKPAYGFRRDFVSLYFPGTKEGDAIGKMGPRPEVDLQVKSLAGIDGSAIIFELVVAVDAAGKVTGCVQHEAPPRDRYAAAACNALGGMAFDKEADAQGRPVAYVRPVLVRMAAQGS